MHERVLDAMHEPPASCEPSLASERDAGVLRYTREYLLSKYQRFVCPVGLEAHTAIYASETFLPELFNSAASVTSAHQVIQGPRVKKTITELVDKPRPAKPRSRPAEGPKARNSRFDLDDWANPNGTADTKGAYTAESWDRLDQRVKKLGLQQLQQQQHTPPAPRDDLLLNFQQLLQKASSTSATDNVNRPHSTIALEDVSLIVRWSDFRPLFLVTPPYVAVAANLSENLLALRGAGPSEDSANSLEALREEYETCLVRVYEELLKRKAVFYPAPTREALHITPATSIALYPSFRELFLHTEPLLHSLEKWEYNLQNPSPPPGGGGGGGGGAGGGGGEIETDLDHHHHQQQQQHHHHHNHLDNLNIADIEWEYLDPSERIRGPFTSAKMFDWFARDFFPAHLPVRRAGDTGPFHSLLKLYPLDARHLHVPFKTLPIAWSPHPIVPLRFPQKQQKESRPSLGFEDSPPVFTSQPPHPSVYDEPQAIYSSPVYESQPPPIHDASSVHYQPLEMPQDIGLQFEPTIPKPQSRQVVEEMRASPPVGTVFRAQPEEKQPPPPSPQPTTCWNKKSSVELVGQTASEDVGPSLAESRTFTREGSNDNGLGAPSRGRVAKKAKGKKQALGELLTESSGEVKSVWVQTAKPSNIWNLGQSNAAPAPPTPKSPMVSAAPPASKLVAEDFQHTESPIANGSTTATSAPIVDPSVREDMQRLCVQYGIRLNEDFIDLLASLPGPDDMSSVLQDNLTTVSGTQVDAFVQELHDLIKNPFKPVRKGLPAASTTGQRGRKKANNNKKR